MPILKVGDYYINTDKVERYFSKERRDRCSYGGIC